MSPHAEQPSNLLTGKLNIQAGKKVLFTALCSGKQESRICDLGEILQPSLT